MGYYHPPRHDMQRFREVLRGAIRGEKLAIAYYPCIAQMAPDPTAREMIDHVIEDEMEHLEAFSDLYHSLYRQDPDVLLDYVPEFDTYEEGLRIAFADELEAAEFYRDVMFNWTQMGTPANRVFHWAMLDEMEHMSVFAFLLADASH